MGVGLHGVWREGCLGGCGVGEVAVMGFLDGSRERSSREYRWWHYQGFCIVFY